MNIENSPTVSSRNEITISYEAEAEVQIRNACANDVIILQQLIKEMSDYERLPLTTTSEQLLKDGFGDAPIFQALLVFVNGQAAGYALTHPCFDSFDGRGLFLEDLYVREQFRHKNVGRRLLSAVVRVAQDQHCFGVVLNILRWNAAALTFFQQAGAIELDDRAIFRIPRDRFGTS